MPVGEPDMRTQRDDDPVVVGRAAGSEAPRKVVPGAHHVVVATPLASALVAVLRDAVGMEVRGHQEIQQAQVADLYGWLPTPGLVRSTFVGSKSTGFIEVVDTAEVGGAADPGESVRTDRLAGARCFTSLALFVDDLPRCLNTARKIESAHVGAASVVHTDGGPVRIGVVDVAGARLQLVEVLARGDGRDDRYKHVTGVPTYVRVIGP